MPRAETREKDWLQGAWGDLGGVGNVLYLDYGGGYMVVCICRKSEKCAAKFTLRRVNFSVINFISLNDIYIVNIFYYSCVFLGWTQKSTYFFSQKTTRKINQQEQYGLGKVLTSRPIKQSRVVKKTHTYMETWLMINPYVL